MLGNQAGCFSLKRFLSWGMAQEHWGTYCPTCGKPRLFVRDLPQDNVSRVRPADAILLRTLAVYLVPGNPLQTTRPVALYAMRWASRFAASANYTFCKAVAPPRSANSGNLERDRNLSGRKLRIVQGMAMPNGDRLLESLAD